MVNSSVIGLNKVYQKIMRGLKVNRSLGPDGLHPKKP